MLQKVFSFILLNIHKVKRAKALLLDLITNSKDRYKALDSLEELEQLAYTAGYDVFEKLLQVRSEIDPAYYIGKGKAKEIAHIVRTYSIDVLIFNKELSHIQLRNLEEALGCKVLDRTKLILEIFSAHARTSEAKIQVELANLEYEFSHLTGWGKELSRLGGGIGTRGPGEPELEKEKRKIKRRIDALRKKLKDIERTKKLHRLARKDAIKVSLVGYTNVGKSTLLNKLTSADVYTDDKLFATLDTTTRILKLEGIPYRILLSDTVGFIKDIPTHLIASFKATLGVLEDADVLLHVVDVSHYDLKQQIEVVESILSDMELDHKRRILVFNKVDMLASSQKLSRLKHQYPDAVFVSALYEEGLDELKQAIKQAIKDEFVEFQITLDAKDYEKYANIRKYAFISEESFKDSMYIIKGIIHRRYKHMVL